MVKYWSPKPADMGSNPIPSAYRDIVQWLEHFSDTEGVIGSSPIIPTYSDVFQW